MRKCEKCGINAYCYGMGRYSGDWGGYYCKAHVPTGFSVIPIRCKGCPKQNMDTHACDLDDGYCLYCCACEEHSEWKDSK